MKSSTETICIDGIDLEVEYYVIPPCRGARDSFGFQLEPDEPGGIEIEQITVVTQEPFNFEDVISITHDRIEEKLLEAIQDEQDDFY